MFKLFRYLLKNKDLNIVILKISSLFLAVFALKVAAKLIIMFELVDSSIIHLANGDYLAFLIDFLPKLFNFVI